MSNRILVAACSLGVLLAAVPAGAIEYAGYLSVNDEDYGYWQFRVRIKPDEAWVPLDEHDDPINEPIAFEVGHDMARGLVRQYIRPPATSSSATSMSAAEDAVASGGTEMAPPRGEGTWVFLADFGSIGFGQYEGSQTTEHVYCMHGAKLWAWLAGPKIEGEDPDDTANRVIEAEDGRTYLKLGCDRPMTVEHE